MAQQVHQAQMMAQQGQAHEVARATETPAIKFCSAATTAAREASATATTGRAKNCNGVGSRGGTIQSTQLAVNRARLGGKACSSRAACKIIK